MITPRMDPMPPKTTMDRMMADSMKVKLAGLIKVVLAANMVPAMPAQVAPRAKGGELGPGLVDAHGLAGDLVLAQGHPSPAQTGILEAD